MVIEVAGALAKRGTASRVLGFVPTAIDKAPGRGFAYVLGAVEGRKRAAQTAGSLHRGPMPGKQDSGETATNAACGSAWPKPHGACSAPPLDSQNPSSSTPNPDNWREPAMSPPDLWIDKIFTKLTLAYGREFIGRWKGWNWPP